MQQTFAQAIAKLDQARITTVNAIGQAVDQTQEKINTLKLGPVVPCCVCGSSTRGGDGGACGDVKDMVVNAGTAAPDGDKTAESTKPRCRSCLTAAEKEKLPEEQDKLKQCVDGFLAGIEQVHAEPEEKGIEKAHRLGSIVLGGVSQVLSYVPGVPTNAARVATVVHGIVKFGPLALYQIEAVEALQLLAVLAARADVPGSAVVTGSSQNFGQAVRDAGTAATDVSELSVSLYYLFVEQRNAVGLDPDRPAKSHSRCEPVSITTLSELADALPLACPIAYAKSAADAQRQLHLLRGSWRLVSAVDAGPGGQPSFILAADQKAKKAAVLVPGTHTPADCVTDLRAFPVELPLGRGKKGWAHRGMLRQACALVRLLGSVIEKFEKDGYDVFFVGHSLGAGVSALAGAVLRLGLEGPKSQKIRSVCFATPACTNAALSKLCEAHAVTVINCDDIVPRLSIETAKTLRSDLEARREECRAYLSQDIAALQDVQNVTSLKRRTSIDENPEESAQKLASLSVPAPQAKVDEETRAAAQAPVRPPTATPPDSSVAKPKPKPRPKGFCLCFGKPPADDYDDGESLKDEEPEPDDPSQIKLYPPGRLIHLYRHCGACRACWVDRNHPELRRIQVMYDFLTEHLGDSYKKGLEEALSAAGGARPAAWKPFGAVTQCACCKSDFAWASVLKSEPHKLQARHHCHSCGDVVCDGCSQRKRPLPQFGVMHEVRICDRCFLGSSSAAPGSRV